MAVGQLSADPGFGRGQTLGVKDADQGKSVEGTIKVFTDTDPRTSEFGKFYSNRPVTCVAVRNTSGGPLLPGTAVKFKAAAILTEVDGAAADADAAPYGIVDEYLPASGVADKDVFWVVAAGPTKILTAATLAAGAKITITSGKAAAAAANTVAGFAIQAPEGTGATKSVRALIGGIAD
jgi:hypothetical protein